MNKAAANKTTTGRKQKPPTEPDGRVIALQLTDTAWRVALPILLLSYTGIRLDRHFGTSPLYTLIGFFLSLALATLLVYRQITQLYPGFFKSGKGAAK
jgi:hypothetical protein